MTTPPTTAQVDTFMNSTSIDGSHSNFLALFEKNHVANMTSDHDMVYWVVAYTDNGNNQHFEALGVFDTGAAGASDSQIEESSPPLANGGGPFYGSSPGGALTGSPEPTNAFQALPYLTWLKQAYGSILLRGYLIPAVSDSLSPVSSTVQTWVNDNSNWPTPG